MAFGFQPNDHLLWHGELVVVQAARGDRVWIRGLDVSAIDTIVSSVRLAEHQTVMDIPPDRRAHRSLLAE